MAQLISVRLSRDGVVPWGFRLQGGKDFGTPLVIQKVNGGSPAEKAGLLAGDAVISVAGTEVFNLRHKDAQDVIVRSGQGFEITVQRGGSTWKPQVQATGGIPKPSGPLPSYITPVTKTSLAAKPQDPLRIGSGHNNQARPFGAHLNGTGGDPVKSIVNKQYNTPVGIYSEQTIAETLSAQAEVLAGGVLGVNFKKNEKIYNAANSEVLKMLQEAENDPEPSDQPNHFYSTASHAIGGRGTSPRPTTPKKAFYEKIIANDNQSENVASDESRISSVPIGQPQTLQIGPDSTQAGIDNNQSSVPATPLCSLCERFIVGVFVRIKEKNLHVECFKCSTCGSSLKNQGYYSINNKLYCDVHAKLAAIQKPPPGTEGMIPVPVAPGGKIPVSTISAALSAHSTPLNGGTAPPSAAPFNVSGNLSGPKPYGFSSVSSPLSPSIAPVSAPLPTYSAPAPAPQSNPIPSFNNHAATLPRPATQQIPGSFNWPPNKTEEEVPTASPLYIPPSPSQFVPNPPPQSTPVSEPKENPKDSEDTQSETCSVAPAVEAIPTPWSEKQASCTSEYKSVHFKSSTTSSEVTCESSTTEIGTGQQMYQSQTSVPIEKVYDQPLEEAPKEEAPEGLSNEVEQLTHKQSVCSLEVANITGRRSALECVETISDSIDTQLLVSSITEGTERPKTPPPFVKAPPQQPQTQKVKEAPVEKQECIKQVEIKTPESVKKSEVSVVKETKNTEAGICQKVEVSSQQSETSCSIMQSNHASSIKPLPASNIPNPVPQQWQSQMLKGLTTACDRPFSPLPSICQEISEQACNIVETSTQESVCEKVFQSSQVCQPSEVCQKSEKESITCEKICSETNSVCDKKECVNSGVQQKSDSKTSESISLEPEVKFPHFSAKKVETPLAAALTSMNRPPTPTAPISTEFIPLPEETVPYFPPAIDMTPIRKEDIPGDNSPFLKALIIAPDRPYSPFGHRDVIDQLDDLPTPQSKQSMLSALTVASDRPYSPFISNEDANVKKQAKETVETCVKQKAQDETLQKKTVCLDSVSERPPPSEPKVCALPSHSESSFQDKVAPKTCSLPPQHESTFQEKIAPKPSPVWKPLASFRPVQPFTSPKSNEMASAGLQKITDEHNSAFTNVSIQKSGSVVCEQSQTQQVIQNQQSSVQSCSVQSSSIQSTSIQSSSVQSSSIQSSSIQSTQITSSSEVSTSQSQQESSKIDQIKPKSGLHKPEKIPHYQASLAHLTSQRPVRTPEPYPAIFQEIIDTYVEPEVMSAEKEKQTAAVKKPVARPAQQTTAQTVQAPQQTTPAPQIPCGVWQPPQPAAPKQQIPQILESKSEPQSIQRTGPITMTFQPVVEDQPTSRPRTPCRPLTPSLINKPAPVIPAYQAKLTVCEHLAPEASIYDPVSSGVSRSPTPSRCKSPACGPPQSPLKAQAPRIRDKPEPSYAVQQAGPKQGSLITQAQSNLRKEHQTSQRLMSQNQAEIFNPSGARNWSVKQLDNSADFKAKAEVSQGVDKCSGQFQSKSVSECQLNQQQKSQELSSSTTQIKSGDSVTQIQRKKVVKEEFERTQKATTIEIRKGPDGKTVHQELPSVPHSISEMQQSLPQSIKNQPTSLSDKIRKLSIENPSLAAPAFKSISNQEKDTTAQSAGNQFRRITFPPPPAAVPQKPSPPEQQKPSFLPKQPLFPNQPVKQGFPTKPLGTNATGASSTKPAAVPTKSIPATKPDPTTAPVCDPTPPGAGAGKGGAFGISSAPKRGRGILNKAVGPGARVPLCGACNGQVRGPFITALGRIWCPDHFVCVNSSCKRPLADIGFVEEQGQLYCEYCFEQFIAPPCDKCHGKIKGDCLRAIGKNFHPECFTCCYCGKLFGNNPFFLEEGQAYCEADWNELFTTKCFACGFPVEAGDRWVEALSNNYHSQCFNCTMCKKNLEGQSFYAKGGRPFCKNHAR